MKKSTKQFYPKDRTFCMYSDECKIQCKRKISDYEAKYLLEYDCSWADFRGTEECKKEWK